MTRSEFLAMPMGEFWEAWRAFRKEKDDDRRHTGELARGLGVRIVNLFIKQKITDTRKFWPMPWDTSAEDAAAGLARLSREERQRMAEDFLKKIEKQ